ncbi:MAG: response regulator transcription factor [Bacteroidetes bacterium]|nr:response regulator transcription factor [Bacteroidota bacterium]
MEEIKIILADDHNIVRAGLRALLDKIPGMKVIAEASDGRETLNLIRKHKPDIVLMDIAMPELNGLEVTQIVSKEFPEIGIIILSMHKSDEYVLQALRFGASGYLLKDTAADELEIAIDAVMKGNKYLAPFVSKSVVKNLLARLDDKNSKSKISPLPLEKMTSRQREILQLIAEGNSTKEIAYKLNISTKTVEAHRKQLMNRLQIRDIAGLVLYAIKVGIISNEK